MRKGKTVYHCHGKEGGKPIRTFKTAAEAEAFHKKITKPKKKGR